MKQIESKKSVLGGLRLLAVAFLTLVSLVVKADEKTVQVVINTFENGTVAEKSQSEPDADGNVTVTITVTPSEGFYISKDDIEVIAVLDPLQATRGDDLSLPAGVTLSLEGEDPAELTLSRDYSFTVPDGLGAWVRAANFHEVDKPVTSGKLTDEVTWEVTTNLEAKTPEVILTLEGDGSATLDGETAVPWKDFEDQITDLVIGKGVQELGDGLLDGCQALKAISLGGEKFVPLGKNSLTKDVTVDVYGLLYNEYKDDEGWGAATITSTGSEPMAGVAFKANSYDLFVTKEAMLIPSVLDGYTVTAISGSSVVISPISDRIIPSGVPVLLFSGKVKDDDFRTVTTDEKGTAEAGLLRAAGSGGQHVELGGAYLLYSDVFYLSQEGTVPEGGVYIPVSDGKEEQGGEQPKEELKKTRSFLTIGDDGTTAIDASRLSSLTSHLSGAWYSLDGRRLSGKPTAKGVYIFKGKKMIVR